MSSRVEVTATPVTRNSKNGSDTQRNGVTAKQRSRKQAIDQFCKECSYDPDDKGAGTWRQQIEACVMEDCPLYEFRPVSRTNSPTLLSGVAKTDTPLTLHQKARVGVGVKQQELEEVEK